MIKREFFIIGAGNLWRMKVRSLLTICGVIIANGALVAMLAIASGMQKNIIDTFTDLNLFHTIHVMPPLSGAAGTDSVSVIPETADLLTGLRGERQRQLDDTALAEILALADVVHIYPQDTFDVTLVCGESEVDLTAQALSVSFYENRELGTLVAGRLFESNETPEVVLSLRAARRLGWEPDSLIGQNVHLNVMGRGQLALGLFNYFVSDLNLPDAVRQELEKPNVHRWLERLSRRLLSISGESEIDLTVCGVVDVAGGFGFRLRDVLIPTGVAGGLDRMGFSDPIEVLSKISGGGGTGYSLAVVTIDESADNRAVRDEIEGLGWRTYDFLEQFSQMKKSFLLFDALVGVFGLVALIIACLGITNTMIMSILDRTREIGILKSLGAENGHIRLLFLIESGLIGVIGSIGGIILGWFISRIASFFLKRFMEAEGVPAMEMFHYPLWLIVGAFLFGVLVSLLAGSYPAQRAARIDPVRALRNE
jgi:putative ABC transport system permease protein